MIIPGIIIAILTFPGVIVHEFAHMFFCKLLKIPVLDVKFFQFDMNTAGYVLHEDPMDFNKSFLVSIGPFFVNTILCLLICFPASISYGFFNISDPLSFFLMWLGVSIGMHAFPSSQDSKNVLDIAGTEIKKKNLLAIISIPVFGLFMLANLLRIIWFDAIYGVAIGIGLPVWIYNLLL